VQRISSKICVARSVGACRTLNSRLSVYLQPFQTVCSHAKRRGSTQSVKKLIQIKRCRGKYVTRSRCINEWTL